MPSKYDLVVFNDDEVSLEVKIDQNNETVWLSQNEMTKLFGVDRSRIVRHISNIYKEQELEKSATCAENAQVQNESNRQIRRRIKYYNLDMIIAVGYRVNSKRGTIFRKWANNILKQYLIQGYTINEKRLNALNKTIDIQNRILANSLDIDSNELYNVINEYTEALSLLDDYDHNRLVKPKGNRLIHQLSYEECHQFISSMKNSNQSSIFGVEKEEGKLEGILLAVFQSAFGKDIYDTLEEKAANLLYFLIKDHPFVDGCKRIGATIFLEFLHKNNALMKDNKIILTNSELVAITLLIAESNPKEKDIMIKLIMHFLLK